MSIYPVNTYPGSQPGLPMGATASLFGRTPMFAGDNGPRYTGPFNLNAGQGGPMMQMLAPMLLQGFMGGGKFPAQFNPEQNLYTQYQANKFYNAGQQAMRMAAERDTNAVENTLGGITQMFTGKPLSEVQSARNLKLAQGISQFTPMLTQMLGPDLVDRLHGSRGSATVFAQQFHQALRTGLDPVTGDVSYSGDSSGRVTQEVYEQLFGDNYDPTTLRGMSAGQAGMAVNELQARGLLGRSLGGMSVQEQRGAVSDSLDAGTIDRIAKSVLAAQDIANPNAAQITAARNQVQDSHRRIKDPSVDLSLDELQALPGGEGIIQAADADRISGRLKNMAGAVRAMRDIFGDMGNPNAPMREIINGLDALTQGGLATMSSSSVEAMVRKTHNIAKQTGIGVQGMIGLTAQYANTADQLGLDRSFAVRTAQQSALFGAAAGDTLNLDMPVWGAMSKEQLALVDGQLRMHAAASPLANQLGSIMRMSETGMIDPAEGSELSSIVSAIRNGQRDYEFDGRSHSLAMRRSKLFDVLSRDAGLTYNEAQAVIMDRSGNQKHIQEFNTDQITRKHFQLDEVINNSLAPAVGGRLRNVLDEDGISELLINNGTIKNNSEFGVMMHRIGSGIASDFMRMDSKTRKDDDLRREALQKSFKYRTREQLKAYLPKDTSDAEVDAMVEEVIARRGGETGLAAIAETSYAVMNTVFSRTPLKNAQVAADVHSPEAQQRVAVRERLAEADSIKQTALSALGTSGPIRRVADALQEATGETDGLEILSDTLNGVDVAEIEQHDPTGTLAQMFGLVSETGKLDVRDPKQFKKLKQAATMIRGLNEGGTYAKEALNILDNSQEEFSMVKDPLKLRESLTIMLDPEKAKKLKDSHRKIVGDRLSMLVKDEEIDVVADLGKQAATGLGKKMTDESKDVMRAFVRDTARRSRQLMQDDSSMAQLGKGGLKLVRDASAMSTKLQTMAADKEISVEELIRQDPEARKLFDGMRGKWAEIQRRRGYVTLPGQGLNKENRKREAMTAEEKKDLEASQEFLKKGSVADRAEDVFKRLTGLTSRKTRVRLEVDSNRDKLMAAITDGDRSVGLDRALRGRDSIMEMAMQKGVFGDKKLEELTAEERASAYDRVARLNLDDTERDSLQQFKKMSDPLSGLESLDPGDAAVEMLQRINQFNGAAVPVEDKQDKKMDVTVTGVVTVNEDGTANLNLNGPGLMDTVQNASGTV